MTADEKLELLLKGIHALGFEQVPCSAGTGATNYRHLNMEIWVRDTFENCSIGVGGRWGKVLSSPEGIALISLGAWTIASDAGVVSGTPEEVFQKLTSVGGRAQIRSNVITALTLMGNSKPHSAYEMYTFNSFVLWFEHTDPACSEVSEAGKPRKDMIYSPYLFALDEIGSGRQGDYLADEAEALIEDLHDFINADDDFVKVKTALNDLFPLPYWDDDVKAWVYEGKETEFRLREDIGSSTYRLSFDEQFKALVGSEILQNLLTDAGVGYPRHVSFAEALTRLRKSERSTTKDFAETALTALGFKPLPNDVYYSRGWPATVFLSDDYQESRIIEDDDLFPKKLTETPHGLALYRLGEMIYKLPEGVEKTEAEVRFTYSSILTQLKFSEYDPSTTKWD